MLSRCRRPILARGGSVWTATTGGDAVPADGNGLDGTSLYRPYDVVLATSCKELAALGRVPALRSQRHVTMEKAAGPR